MSFSITVKYHLRFNENRKFHELINVDLDLSKKAHLIDVKLKGLKWITPHHSDNPKSEIDFLKNTLKILKEDKRKKMVITNYLFFSAIMNEKLYSPSKTYTLNGGSFPVKGNKYYLNYKNYPNSNLFFSNFLDFFFIFSQNVDLPLSTFPTIEQNKDIFSQVKLINK